MANCVIEPVLRNTQKLNANVDTLDPMVETNCPVKRSKKSRDTGNLFMNIGHCIQQACMYLRWLCEISTGSDASFALSVLGESPT